MNQDALSQMSKISISSRAAKVLGRIIVSCPITSSDFSDFKSIETLADLNNIAPITMIDLSKLAGAKDKNEIDSTDVIEVFAGLNHLKSLQLRASGEGLISTGQTYQQRLAELEIDLSSQLSKAEFCLIDILTAIKVSSIDQDEVSGTRKLNGQKPTRVKNCYLPAEIKLDQGDLALVHYGVVVGVVGQDISLDYWLEILDQQNHYGYFRTMLKLLSDSTIDCRKICSNLDKDLSGFDTTDWAESRL